MSTYHHFFNPLIRLSNILLYLLRFLEWSTITVMITISVSAPMMEPATIPAVLPEGTDLNETLFPLSQVIQDKWEKMGLDC